MDKPLPPLRRSLLNITKSTIHFSGLKFAYAAQGKGEREKWKKRPVRVVDLFSVFLFSFFLLAFAVSPDVVAVVVAFAVCSGRINILTHFIVET